MFDCSRLPLFLDFESFKFWILDYVPDARQRKLRVACSLSPPLHPLSHPCTFSNKIADRRKYFVNVTEIQFQRRKKSNYFAARTKTSTQTKATTNALPMVNAMASISNIKYVNWVAIQNMTNRPWLRQAYNGLLVLVIKCFHLVQKFQIFLSHHLFRQIYGQRPLLLLTIIRSWSFIFMWIGIKWQLLRNLLTWQIPNIATLLYFKIQLSKSLPQAWNSIKNAKAPKSLDICMYHWILRMGLL